RLPSLRSDLPSPGGRFRDGKLRCCLLLDQAFGAFLRLLSKLSATLNLLYARTFLRQEVALEMVSFAVAFYLIKPLGRSFDSSPYSSLRLPSQRYAKPS